MRATIEERIDPTLKHALTQAEAKLQAAWARAAEVEARARQPLRARADLEAAAAQQEQTAQAEQAHAVAQQAFDVAYAERWQADYDQAMEQLRTVVAEVDAKIAAHVRDSAALRRRWADEMEAAVNRRDELADQRPTSLTPEALGADMHETQDGLRRVLAARASAGRRERTLDGDNPWQ